MKTHLPYYEDKTTVTVRDETVEIKAFQVIVWKSISTALDEKWDSRTPKFPAILDIGNNHNFAITEDQLVRWAGIQTASLKPLKKMRDKGIIVPLCSAALWLHVNGNPFALNVDEGIAVYPSDGPRLPTLGLRALTNNKLRALIHGDQKRVILRTPPLWDWPF